MSEKASATAEQVKGKLSHTAEAAREKMAAVRDRAGDMTAKAKDRAREAYTHTRERVATSADEHPLEIGLITLAAGLIAGLALPTPRAVVVFP